MCILLFKLLGYSMENKIDFQNELNLLNSDSESKENKKLYLF